jgi:hypothetical protein
MPKRFAPIVLALLVLVGLSITVLTGAIPAVPQGAAVSAQSVFQPFYQGPILSDEKVQAAREALPYESLTLERSGGMVVPGGLFKLTLKKDGAATLWTDGSRFGRAGHYVGTVSLFDYAKVNHLIVEVALDQLSPRYAVNWSDMQEVTVTVSTRNRTFAVADYGGAGPVRVWAVQRAIEATGLNINWKPK